MRLLLIRHAIAVPRGTPGIADDKRPLTPEGETKFRLAARGLSRIVDPPDALLTSPLVRARQTAEIAAEVWKGPVRPRVVEALIDANWDELLPVLESYSEDSIVALIGHEPSLSKLLAKLLRAREPERLEFRKGGTAFVAVTEGLSAGGTLLWFNPSRVLRKLGAPPKS